MTESTICSWFAQIAEADMGDMNPRRMSALQKTCYPQNGVCVFLGVFALHYAFPMLLFWKKGLVDGRMPPRP